MSELSEYVIFFISVAFAATTVMVGVRWKYGRGLATRIFNGVVPTIGFIACLGFLVGKLGTTAATLGTLVPIGTIATTVTLLWLYRIVVKKLDEQVQFLATITAQIAAAAKQSASSSAEQASMTTEVVTTVEEITQTSAAASENAQEVAQVARDAAKRGQDGLEAVARAVEVMESVSQVGEIVDTINALAEQSNLLAVNASIEAAKAGEHGRGFAVVASEVRSLSEQSKAATKQIRQAIRRTEEGQEATSSVNVVVTELAAVLRKSSDKAREIAGAALQQSTGIKQISDAMTSVAQGSKDTAVAAAQLDQAVQGLKQVSSTIQQFVRG